MGWVVFTLMRSSWATKQNEFVEQPIQFSHAHHVGGVGLDCRYCHTSVEKSSFAGIPPTKTCMNCHSQLWTNAPILEPVRASFRDDKNLDVDSGKRPARLRLLQPPDPRETGRRLRTCHGPVDKMPLMYQAQSLLMEWCLDCHRAPEKYLRPRDEVFNMAYAGAGRTSSKLGHGAEEGIQRGRASST